MKINAESKFDICQEVYCLESYRDYKKCDMCNGEEEIKVIIKGEKTLVKCPYCNGSGDGDLVTLWKLSYGEIKWSIDGLWMNMRKYNNCKPEFGYSVTCSFPKGGNCSISVHEENCFLTLEEALLEIERRNNDPQQY